jgi:DNA-binding PadR family transcriptional regulator
MDDMDAVSRTLLRTIALLGDEAYGLPVWDATRAVHRRLSLATMYFKLESLEEQGYVTSWEMPGGPERGYHIKRYWRLTDKWKEEV